MASNNTVNLSSSSVRGIIQAVKLEQDVAIDVLELRFKENKKGEPTMVQKLTALCTGQEFEDDRNSEVLSTVQSGASYDDQEQSPIDDCGPSSSSSLCPAPVCRQFWKAGDYDSGVGSKVSVQNAKNHLQVHPKFLHSNATSHKWAFGAVAELVDNAVDEIHRGASFVKLDKTIHSRDGAPALLIQDDGGGMDPETMRRCMSFGFSQKKSKNAIGQYGNGFKTSTMRLGGDVVVFSRYLNNKICMQSVGLLSYTFLTLTEHDRIVVPMVDYRLNPSSGKFEILHDKEHFMSNLSVLLKWSPYSTEADLLNQFNDIGSHGTKVIIYNLWFNEDQNMELDFDTDPEDIRIGGDTRKINVVPAYKSLNEKHIANRLHYSLREYLSILYLRIPQSFKIILCGRVVALHNLADDLKFPEYILYKPQSAGCVEGMVVTTIGFLKDAPHVSIHGFNVYHKNRLILVVRYSDNRGRGVVGVLEANFIEPTHNKQDFEKTSLLQKLEGRLKDMTWEYWDFHCGLIGYKVKKNLRPLVTSEVALHGGLRQPLVSNESSKSTDSLKGKALGKVEEVVLNSLCSRERGASLKRKERDLADIRSMKNEVLSVNTNQPKDQEAMNLSEENKKLHLMISEYEKLDKELRLKATKLQNDIKEVQLEYSRLLAELQCMDDLKGEKDKLGSESVGLSNSISFMIQPPISYFIPPSTGQNSRMRSHNIEDLL